MDLSNKKLVERLVKACARRDRSAQQQLYQKLYSPMMGVCFRYARNKEEAKDLLQDGFIKVFDKIERFNFKGSLEGWVRRIMVNHAIDHYRKNKNKFSMSETLVEAENIPEHEEGENWAKEVQAKTLLAFVQKLSPVYRTVFNLYVLDDYSHAEIAEELGISEGTSKSNLAKAKQNLRNMILEYRKNEAK
jgi:RNA polymerase sigma-70 factor (ECF subfamily)